MRIPAVGTRFVDLAAWMRWLRAACVKPRAFAAAVKLLSSAAFEKVSR
jgi:hypothetical protein